MSQCALVLGYKQSCRQNFQKSILDGKGILCLLSVIWLQMTQDPHGSHVGSYFWMGHLILDHVLMCLMIDNILVRLSFLKIPVLTLVTR